MLDLLSTIIFLLLSPRLSIDPAFIKVHQKSRTFFLHNIIWIGSFLWFVAIGSHFPFNSHHYMPTWHLSTDYSLWLIDFKFSIEWQWLLWFFIVDYIFCVDVIEKRWVIFVRLFGKSLASSQFFGCRYFRLSRNGLLFLFFKILRLIVLIGELR